MACYQNLSRASKLYLNNSEIYDPAGFAAKLAPQYHELTGLDIFLRGDVNPADWHAGDYEMNSFHSENLIHRTPAGVLMRSKSEVLIGSQLERRGIPYHYEPVIECGDKLYSPDIEILHPRLTRLVYWEHFGMADDPVYTEKMLKKLKDYGKAGIVPGYNLFYTYETRAHPLTITAINEVIDEILDLQY